MLKRVLHVSLHMYTTVSFPFRLCAYMFVGDMKDMNDKTKQKLEGVDGNVDEVREKVFEVADSVGRMSDLSHRTNMGVWLPHHFDHLCVQCMSSLHLLVCTVRVGPNPNNKYSVPPDCRPSWKPPFIRPTPFLGPSSAKTASYKAHFKKTSI